MNENIHTYIKKAGEEVSLTHEEREQMRRTIHAYMEMKPLRSSMTTESARPTPSNLWFFSPRAMTAAVLITLFASSGGVSYAAQRALPGDLLYAVKTGVNEPVAGALSVSASAKAAWAMDVAGERVKEAATLAADGRLSSTIQAELESNFDEHAKAAEGAIAQQASANPEKGSETAVRFEAQLSEYANVLTQVAAAKNTDVAPLADSIRAHASRVIALDGRGHATVAATSASDTHDALARVRVAAQAQLDASMSLADAASGSLSSSSARLVTTQLRNASNTIAAANTLDATRASSETIGTLRNVLNRTEKLGVFLQTSTAIHARTGLIIGEPNETSRATSPAQHMPTNNAPYLSNGETGIGASGASTGTGTAVGTGTGTGPSTLLSSSSVSTPSASTDTTPSGSTEMQPNVLDQPEQHTEDAGQSEGTGQSDIPSLPVSVPLIP